MLKSIAQSVFKKLHHDAIERTHDFSRAIGHWHRLAPGIGFSNAEAVLSQDVRSDVLCGADRQQSQDVGIGVDLLNWRRVIGHGSCFTPLRNWVDEMPKTKATLLFACCGFFCHSKIREASGVINYQLSPPN